MYQKIIIIGRLGRDPEMRYTPSGQSVTSFSVATDRRWTDANGQRQERTTWFRVSAWGKLGEICNQYLSKGRQVMIEGEMQEPRPYQGRDGEWRVGDPRWRAHRCETRKSPSTINLMPPEVDWLLTFASDVSP